MRLLTEWRLLLAKAWSIRFALLSAFLVAVELVLQYALAKEPSAVLIALAGVVSFASAVARVVDQPKMREGKSDEPDDHPRP